MKDECNLQLTDHEKLALIQFLIYHDGNDVHSKVERILEVITGKEENYD